MVLEYVFVWTCALERRAWEEKPIRKGKKQGYRERSGLCTLLVPLQNSFPVAQYVRRAEKAQGAMAMPHCTETAGTTTSVLHPYNLNSPLRP